jgi:tRNA-2-methylthio-N6-dimethylallyladenosine synthase
MPIKIYLTFARSGRRRNAINDFVKRRNLWDISPVRLMSNGITALVSITWLRQYVYVLRGTFTRGRSAVANHKASWRKSKIYGTRDLKRLHFGTKRWQLPGMEVVEKDFVAATEMQKATAVDFDQLLKWRLLVFQNAYSLFDIKSTRYARKCVARDCQAS